MSIFNGKIDESTLIVGCGRLGASLANIFSEKEENVLIIDNSKDSFRKLSPSFTGLTIVGNAIDFNVLKEAQIDKVTTIICVTDYDSTNIMTAQIAKSMYHVENVIIRLYDPERACTYQDMGFETILPAILSTAEITKRLDKKRGIL